MVFAASLEFHATKSKILHLQYLFDYLLFLNILIKMFNLYFDGAKFIKTALHQMDLLDI